MRVVRERMLRIVRGPAGGMLAMLLLAAALSGVAAADPGAGNGTDPADPQAQVADDHPEVVDDQPGTDEGPGIEDQQTGVPAEPQRHTAVACQGMIQGLDLPDAQHATGLDSAILKIETDCEQNLTAPGLMVALERLIANRERHAEHEAAKAEEGHGRDVEHGHSAEHGPDAEHGSAEHGPDAQPGPGAEHGNSAAAPGLADRSGNAGS